MNIQPKTFVARCDFNFDAKDYTAGEVITGRKLGHLIAAGFAVEANPRTPPAATPTNKKEGDPNALDN